MKNLYKETKEKWRRANKDKVNQRRRELRAEKRKAKLTDKRCLLCEFPLVSKFAGCKVARVYCNQCTQKDSVKVARHRWMRYYSSKTGYKKNAQKLVPLVNRIESYQPKTRNYLW